MARLVAITILFFLILLPSAGSGSEPQEFGVATEGQLPYRVSGSGSLFLPDEDQRGGGWFSLEYTRRLRKRVDLDLELGWGPQIQLEGSEQFTEGSSRTSHRISTDNESIVVGQLKLRYWLILTNTVGLTCFGGLGVWNLGYRYGIDAADPLGYSSAGVSSSEPFLVSPAGFSLHLFPGFFVSWRLDAGYVAGLKELQVAYDGPEALDPVSIRPQGLLFSSAFSLYLN